MKYAALISQRGAIDHRFVARVTGPPQWSSIADKLRSSNVGTLYALHALSLLGIVVATITFWSYGVYRPVLFPYETGLWIQSHQNFVTILCTILGTLLSTLTLFLLNGLLVLMGKMVITTQGASLSTIEVWNRMFNRDYVLDKGRVRISLLTCIFSFGAFYLATAYTTLITPTSVLVTESISGTELDFHSDAFWSWYNTRDATGDWNRTISGCQWYTYENNKGKTTFPTCPYNNDPVSLLSAGVAAAQNGLTIAKPAVNYLDKRFEGSTGGIMPLAWAGFSPFTDVQFDHWTNNTAYPSYNYSLAQQGLTAEVSCQATNTTPIQQTIKDTIDSSILGIDNGRLNMVNFTWTCPDGGHNNAQFATPFESWATLVICGSEVIKEYTVYIGAFGKYAELNYSGNVAFFPNLTCSLKPLLTNATVKYTTDDGLFHVERQDRIANSSYRVPNETRIAIDRIFSLATSNSENMIIDSLHGLVRTNTSISIASGMEHTLRGYIEYFATNLRMYYTANEPPGQRPVTGNYTVWRVGYDGEAIVLASLLPPLLLICALAIAYLILGMRAGTTQITLFDPVDVLSLLAASAAGGRAGELSLTDASVHGRKEKFLGTRVKYDANSRRLKEKAARALDEDELELVEHQARPITPRVSETFLGSENLGTPSLVTLSPTPSPSLRAPSEEWTIPRKPIPSLNSSPEPSAGSAAPVGSTWPL